MSENTLKNKSYSFALAIIQITKQLVQKNREFILSKQLVRSGTSIGALVREAEHAQSKPDFIHKLSIAQKECNETAYWLDLLKGADYIDSTEHIKLKSKCTELMKLLTSILKTTKRNLKISLTTNH